jgi:glycosyltransferase involved in cell wall biosynthesis
MADNVERPHRHRLVEVAKSLYLRAFDGFLVGGRKHTEYFSTLGVTPAKLAIGYDCVDNDRIARLVRDIRENGNRPFSAPYLLTVSRLIDRKNTQAIVRALSTYARDLHVGARPFHLVVAGDGPQRRHLEELSATLDVANLVHFTGELGDLKEVALYYAFASAFILASSFDEWGLVINEAMAAGLPIVAATQVGAAPDLVAEGINGFTFDAHSHAALAVILRHLHDMYANLPILGNASRSIIDRFSPDVFAANAASFLNG